MSESSTITVEFEPFLHEDIRAMNAIKQIMETITSDKDRALVALWVSARYGVTG